MIRILIALIGLALAQAHYPEMTNLIGLGLIATIAFGVKHVYPNLSRR